jgi:hypothetical protein
MRSSNRPAPLRTMAALGMLALATIAEAGRAPDPCGALRAKNSELSAYLVDRDSELASLRLEIAALRSRQRSETAPREAGGGRRAPSNLTGRRRQCQEGPMLPGQTSLECSPMTGEKPVDGGPPQCKPARSYHSDTRLSKAAELSERIVSCEHGRACASPWHAIGLVATRCRHSTRVRPWPLSQTRASGRTTACATCPAHARQATTPTAVRPRSRPPHLSPGADFGSFAPFSPLFGCVPGGTVALFRSAVVFSAAPFDGMVDFVTARVGVTFDCIKDCRTATCAIDWSSQELSTLPENFGLLSCRGRITKMCATPAYRSGSVPDAATICGSMDAHRVVLGRDARFNDLSSIPESICLLRNLTSL